jgi:ketosteroid isomerase-like protein
MSEENVDRVRRGYEAFNRNGPDAILEFLDEDIEWHTPEEDVQRGDPYVGHDGVLEFWRLYMDQFEGIQISPEEILDGGDCVLVLSENRARGKLSGVPGEIHDAHLWRHSPVGLATSLHMFLNRERALQAAGLKDDQ